MPTVGWSSTSDEESVHKIGPTLRRQPSPDLFEQGPLCLPDSLRHTLTGAKLGEEAFALFSSTLDVAVRHLILKRS